MVRTSAAVWSAVASKSPRVGWISMPTQLSNRPGRYAIPRLVVLLPLAATVGRNLGDERRAQSREARSIVGPDLSAREAGRLPLLRALRRSRHSMVSTSGCAPGKRHRASSASMRYVLVYRTTPQSGSTYHQ